ncbi:MAG: glycosyltransferase [Planctomycetes bacterium]|nr:glycosyltransferase [Planctomycetota bacterium]
MNGSGACPAVSVVIPALADAAALAANVPRLALLAGVREIVVADAGGNEAARTELAQAGARVIACRAGRGAQLNAGAAAATGEFLLFLHADCWLEDGAIDAAHAALASPGVGAVVFRQRIDGTRSAYRWIERAASRRALRRRCPYGDSGLFLRRRDFERIGGYPDLPLCEDLALAPRLRTLGTVAEAAAVIHLSARRWERHGIVKTTILNFAIGWGFRFGVAPAKLYRAYYGRAPGEGVPAAACVARGGVCESE